MIVIKITGDFKGQNAKHPDKVFNKRATADAERAALYAAEQKAMDMYRRTTTTWSHRPKWVARRRKDGWTIYVSTNIYRFLDQGTEVRYATMTRDFKAKTRVGQFASYNGRGGLAYVNTAKPKPGIAARGWTLKVAVEVEKIIKRVYREKLHTNWVNG